MKSQPPPGAALAIATVLLSLACPTRFDSAEHLWTAGLAVTAVGIGLGAWATWLHLHAPKSTAWQIDAGPSVARLTVLF